MREQLIQYVNLLFAGAQNADEIRAEILQNTLDRYDDLIAQGKLPEAAYQLAISGIGDISEILGAVPQSPAAPAVHGDVNEETPEDIKRKKLRGIAIAMYILCAVPVIILAEFGLEILGVCLLLGMVAAATYFMFITGKKDDDDEAEEKAEKVKKNDPVYRLKESIGEIIWIVGLVIYFILSFSTGFWHVTWLIFPILACARGLSNAIIDLKEARKDEN